MSAEEAFYALLNAAVQADGQAHIFETVTVRALIGRTPTLAHLSQADISALHDKINARLTPDKLEGLVINACQSLRVVRPDASRAVFAHCCDIALADRHVCARESKLLDLMVKTLSIPPDDAEEIMRVMRIKNRH